MSDLDRQLADVNFELRLRPTPSLLKRKEEIRREMADAFKAELSAEEASRKFAASFIKLQAVDYPQANIEPSRCRGCGHLVREPGYCHACKVEGKDWTWKGN
jgi:rubrerythrin